MVLVDYPVNTSCMARDFSGSLMLRVKVAQLPSFYLEHFLFNVLCISLEKKPERKIDM